MKSGGHPRAAAGREPDSYSDESSVPRTYQHSSISHIVWLPSFSYEEPRTTTAYITYPQSPASNIAITILTRAMYRKLSLLAVGAVLVSGASAVDCPSEPVRSCTDEAESINDCCVSRPGGLMVFRQRFEPDEGDEGRWGIDGLEIMK